MVSNMEGSEVLDVAGETPLVALLIGNMRFGRHHQESNIAGITYQVTRHIEKYQEKRAVNPDLPTLILSGRHGDGTIYSFEPGVAGGLEDSLARIFRSSGDNHASRCEYYLSILASWNTEAFSQVRAQGLSLHAAAGSPVTEAVGEGVTHDRKRYERTTPGSLRSALYLLVEENGLSLDFPLDPANQDVIIDAIVGVLTKRVRKRAHSSVLLRLPKRSAPSREWKKMADIARRRGERPPGDPRIDRLSTLEQYCLVPSPPDHARHGFSRMLKQCFAVNEGRPEGLVKALEREVYKLAKMEKRAFPELFER